MTSLKGVDPDGSQRAWDLYVKSRFIETQATRPRADPRLGHADHQHAGRDVHAAAVHAARRAGGARRPRVRCLGRTFGDTRTELELQPSGLYKPVTRFSEFVNVPELIAMFRTFADVVLRADLRHLLTLPRLKGGKRQLITAAPSPAFKAYQQRPRRAHQGDRSSAAARRERRRHPACPSSPTDAMPPSTCGSSVPTTTTSRRTSSICLIENRPPHLAGDLGSPSTHGPTACPTRSRRGAR